MHEIFYNETKVVPGTARISIEAHASVRILQLVGQVLYQTTTCRIIHFWRNYFLFVDRKLHNIIHVHKLS